METPVEVVHTATKVGLKFDKTTLVAGAVGLVLGAGTLFGVQKLKEHRKTKQFEAGMPV
jgi:hypothetical protein